MTKYNFNIVANDNNDHSQELLSKSSNVSRSQSKAIEDDLFVDLGLKSGTIWAKYNLGVDPYNLNTEKDWYGDYYAWGELEANKKLYTWRAYSLSYIDLMTKYCPDENLGKDKFKDDLLELESIDDAAYNKCNFKYTKCRIPSNDQYEELINNTNDKYVYNYNGIDRLNGILLASKINDNTIFFPSAGIYTANSTLNDGIGEDGYYWSRTLYDTHAQYAYDFTFCSTRIGSSFDSRCLGESIRYVKYNG